MNVVLALITITLLIILAFKEHEVRQLKRERDYYIEVDEENARLQKKLGEK